MCAVHEYTVSEDVADLDGRRKVALPIGHETFGRDVFCAAHRSRLRPHRRLLSTHLLSTPPKRVVFEQSGERRTEHPDERFYQKNL